MDSEKASINNLFDNKSPKYYLKVIAIFLSLAFCIFAYLTPPPSCNNIFTYKSPEDISYTTNPPMNLSLVQQLGYQIEVRCANSTVFDYTPVWKMNKSLNITAAFTTPDPIEQDDSYIPYTPFTCDKVVSWKVIPPSNETGYPISLCFEG